MEKGKSGAVPVKVHSPYSGKILDRDLSPTEIACLAATGYEVAEVPKVVELKPRTPPKGSEEERTAQGKQWWQKD